MAIERLAKIGDDVVRCLYADEDADQPIGNPQLQPAPTSLVQLLQPASVAYPRG